jgi:hypothetical protein
MVFPHLRVIVVRMAAGNCRNAAAIHCSQCGLGVRWISS